MHNIHRCTHCLHPQSCQRQLVLVSWLLVLASWLLVLVVLDEEVVLAQQVENVKNFQAHFEVLHRLHPNPWTSAFWHSASHSAVAFRQWFSFLFFGTLFLWTLSAVTLNGDSRDFVVPRLLNLQPCLG